MNPGWKQLVKDALQAQAARPDVSARLKAIQGVTVIPRDEDLKYRHAHSRIWNETWLAAFFHKPCNHELFVLQSLNMEGVLYISSPAWRGCCSIMVAREVQSPEEHGKCNDDASAWRSVSRQEYYLACTSLRCTLDMELWMTACDDLRSRY